MKNDEILVTLNKEELIEIIGGLRSSRDNAKEINTTTNYVLSKRLQDVLRKESNNYEFEFED